MKQGTCGHTRKNVRMFVIGRVARKGLLGSMIASTYVLSLNAAGPLRLSPDGTKHYTLPSRNRTYAQGAKRLSAGWMLLT